MIAILVGIAIRSTLSLAPTYRKGVDFSAKILLEFAVMLLGLSIDAQTVLKAGFELLGGIVVVVGISLGGSFLLCRALRLPPRLSVLIASGNSICGNSAIAAVAPIIRATAEEVATSIAFTAVLV